MTPMDFILESGEEYNAPVGDVIKALQKPLIIRGATCDYEILSYYFYEGQMILDIQKKGKK